VAKKTKSNKSELSREERIARVRDKLRKTDTGGGGLGFLSLKTGKNIIRIMPEVGEMEFFFQTVGRHYFPNKKMAYCPSFTSEGELECPICELVDELYKLGDKSSKALAKELRVSRQYWMNAINRADQEAGPLIFTPGVKIFNYIISLINDPDYGDIYNPDEGTDLTIEKSGSGINTDYNPNPRRKITPLHAKDEIMSKWLEDAKDLSWVEVSMDPDEDAKLSEGHAVYLYPYDRLVEEFGLDEVDLDDPQFGGDEDEEEEEVDEDEDDDEDLEEEEDDEDEDVDEEEDEEDEPEVKREVTRRKAARKSSRRKRR